MKVKRYEVKGRDLLALRADDLERLWRMVSGGRLYAEPRTCRLCRRARRKPSSSRQIPFAVLVMSFAEYVMAENMK